MPPEVRPLHPLDDRSRRRLLLIAAMACAGPLLLLPLAGRSAFEVADQEAALAKRFQQPAAHSAGGVSRLTVARDPFLADTGAGSARGPVATHIIQGAVVRAIVTGSPPRALVEEGGHARVVAPGDALSGSRVLRIDGAGVVLQNGTRVKLTEPLL
jgi:hypothetical protein